MTDTRPNKNIPSIVSPSKEPVDDEPALGGSGAPAPAPAPAADELLPPRQGISYLPHQEEGVRWMLERENEDATICRGGILADDMGLGKTFQTIGLIKNGIGPEGSGAEGVPTLIVCPPALMAGWLEELRACGFFVSVLKSVTMWVGETEKPAGAGPTVWLTTYPKADAYRKCRLAGRAGEDKYFWDRVVLDEGHAIRNGKACSRWWAALAFAKYAERRWILSATPVQNGVRDWENLCMFLHCRGVRKGNYAEVGEAIMLRRTMAELRSVISELPPPPRFITHDLNIPVGGREERLFRALCDQLQSAVDSRAVSALIKLELYMRIQQFLVHPQIYIEAMRTKFKGAYPRPDWTDTATKWEAAMEQLEIAVRDRVPTIIFCNFRTEMDKVQAAAVAMGARVWSVRGGMSAETIGDAVSKAREVAEAGVDPVVFVCQIVSGGVGLNLQFCRRILFLSQHWNPAVVHQAVGRAVRIRQKAVVDVHMFRIVDDVMDNLDRRMVQIHLCKIAAAKEVCLSLYEGYAPLREEAFGSCEDLAPVGASEADPSSDSDTDDDDPSGV
jgi:SNF2 family DNA or RNA helicase